MKPMLMAKEINRILDRESKYSARVQWACDRLCWLRQFNKLPRELTDALLDKATEILEGTWYGDEPAQKTINKYLEA